MALGAVQGPAELLPVSSSAHLILIPWLARWDWERLDPELRKSFEVALHAGAAAALLVGQRRVIAHELRSFDSRKAAVLAASPCPPPRSASPSSARSSATWAARCRPLGLLAGAAAMALADRRPQSRERDRADAADGLALGLAQAAALVPGVSRNGATLTAARWRGFTRQHANMLSRTVALPVIVAAAALKGAPPAPARPAARAAAGLRRRDRRLLRLDARLAGPDPAGRARQRALALLRLPRRAGGRRAGGPGRRRLAAGRGEGARRVGNGTPLGPGRDRQRQPAAATSPGGP